MIRCWCELLIWIAFGFVWFGLGIMLVGSCLGLFVDICLFGFVLHLFWVRIAALNGLGLISDSYLDSCGFVVCLLLWCVC